MTPPAFKRYRLASFITSRMMHRLTVVCAQDQTYADYFKQLGVPPDRLSVTGTMKFDTAQVQNRVDGDDTLARDLALSPGNEPIWVCGSTGPGEEPILLAAYRTLRNQFPTLRLVIVPRKPERFDEVAKLIDSAGFGLLRRSTPSPSTPANQPIILGDTMGELRKFYSLADVVFVGRTLIDLGPRQHGSDMIEPAALAKPIAIGPWTNNFAEPMQKLRDGDAIREVQNESALVQMIDNWLTDPAAAKSIGQRAQKIVRENQGATQRHTEILLHQLQLTAPA